MKVFKMFALFSSLSVMLVACSENRYTPTVTAPVVNPGLNSNNYPNGAFNTNPSIAQYPNPYLSYNSQYYSSLSIHAQYRLRVSSQSMFSCAYRRSPTFYSYTSPSSSCAYRRQPTYTPNSCACVAAPCNCGLVLEQVRNRCFPQDDRAPAPDYIGSGSSVTSPDYISTNGSVPTNGLDENSQIAYLSFRGRDARALYERLAKHAEDTHNKTQTKMRSGVNYKCMMDGSGQSNSDYVCDIDVSVANGKVYQISPVGVDGPSALNATPAYHGTSIRIGENGLNPMEAFLKVDDKPAAFIYKKLRVTETMGTNPEQTLSASIKTGQQIKCYKTSSTKAECFIKVSVLTGEAARAN